MSNAKRCDVCGKFADSIPSIGVRENFFGQEIKIGLMDVCVSCQNLLGISTETDSDAIISVFRQLLEVKIKKEQNKC